MHTNPNHRSLRCGSWCRWLAWLAVCAGLAACGAEGSQSTETTQTKLAALTVTGAPSTDLKVVSLTKISETRVNRTVFDYVFRVSVKNTGPDTHAGVVATLTGAGPGTTVIDGVVQAGSVSAGATIVPADTITLRHDRAFIFVQGALVWQLTATPPASTTPGILIPGAPNALAVSLLTEYAAPRTLPDLETATDPVFNTPYYTKELRAVIRDTATVGQVNAALNAVGARIAFSMLKNPVVSLQVPNPGGAAALDQVAATLMASGAFDTVGRIFLPQPLSLPSNVSPAEASDSFGSINLLHQTAARVAAAWPGPFPGTKGALNGDVEVIVIDYFGAGAPPSFTQALSGTVTNADFGITGAQQHGYHVLGIIAGSFGGSSSPVDKVTGVLPINVPLHVIDLAVPIVQTTPSYFVVIRGVPQWVNYYDFMTHRIASILLRNPLKRFVLNFSLGYCNGTSASTPACPERPATMVDGDVVTWRRFTDRIWPNLPTTAPFDYQGQVIQVSAAGNNYRRQAAKGSLWNASALSTVNTASGPLPPLRNGLVVENREVSLPLSSGQRPRPGCLSASSNIDGNIGAIGTNVFSFTGVSSTGLLTGTSMAAPQVAGLAAWLLTVRPTLGPTALLDTLRNTAYAPSTTFPDPCAAQPMVDAFAALLNLDVATADNAFDAPTRRRLLQPNALSVANVFNAAYAKLFLRKIFPTAYPLAPPAPAEADFSEYDLNGDGFTGDAAKRAPFDLKFDRSNGTSPSFDVLDRYPNGTKISLDEKAVTDFEVLCYYVNSSLFDQADRKSFDDELAWISSNLVPTRPISCNDRAVNLYVNATFPNWGVLPAKITLSNFVLGFPATSAGNSSTCTNQGEPAGERGTPFFSSVVPSPVPMFAAIDVVGVPTQTGRPSNRRNCSSFFATTGAQVWINATARAVFGFGGSVVSDWEYQVRYSNGDPNNGNAGRQCTVGTVPGSGIFAPAFSTTACTHEEFVKISQ